MSPRSPSHVEPRPFALQRVAAGVVFAMAGAVLSLVAYVAMSYDEPWRWISALGCAVLLSCATGIGAARRRQSLPHNIIWGACVGFAVPPLVTLLDVAYELLT